MTGNELKNFFVALVDDAELDDTTIWALFNSAKNKLEMEAKPRWLIKKDTSQSSQVGDIYTTMKSLPTDFIFMKKLYHGTQRLVSVPFEDSILHANSPRRFYIDHKNSQFAQTGKVGSSSVYTMFYQMKSEDFDDSNADDEVLTWPDYHLLVAYEAGAIYQSSFDLDDMSIKSAINANKNYIVLREMFMSHCADLGVDDNDGTLGYEDSAEDYPLGLM